MPDLILYKYRDWKDQYAKDLLTKNKIYLSSPRDFNDPFDCRIPPDLQLLKNDEDRKKYVDRLAISQFERIQEQGLDVKMLLTAFDQKLANNLNEWDNWYRQTFFDMQDEDYGIFSLSYIWNSILMWSHYANKHAGFCVGFSEAKLVESGFFSKGGPVKYRDKYPQIDPLSDDLRTNSFIETHTKAKKWEYEKEYRLTRVLPKGFSPEDRVQILEDVCFTEIILGLWFPTNDIELMKGISKRKKIKLYKIVKADRRFELTRIEIS